MLNHIKKLSLIILILAAFLFIGGCSTKTRVNTQTGKEQTDAEKNLAFFSFDVILRNELVVYDENTGNIKIYVRVKHNSIPLQSEKNILAGTIRLGEFEPLGEVLTVRAAIAPSPLKLTTSDIKKLHFKDPEIRPTAKMQSGFNEIDVYGSGTFDCLVELNLKPAQTISSDKEALDYVSDLAYEGKIVFAYALKMDRENNKQLYHRVEVKVPEKVFKTGKEVFLLSFSL
jgi:hypothetical protein